ncbi:hypothetical protein B0H13DRAFT_1885738 [Mycena leptocephala]|nr:hypothetical protein B0H13DRAFT_1885738 [Mycena leptocephala]
MNDKPEEDAPNARVIPPPDSYSSCWSVSDIFHISQHEANEKRSNLKRVGLTHRPVLAPQNFRESPPVAIQGIPFAYSDQHKVFGTGRICESKVGGERTQEFEALGGKQVWEAPRSAASSQVTSSIMTGRTREVGSLPSVPSLPFPGSKSAPMFAWASRYSSFEPPYFGITQESIIPIITRYSSRWKSLQLTIVQPLAFRGPLKTVNFRHRPLHILPTTLAVCNTHPLHDRGDAGLTVGMVDPAAVFSPYDSPQLGRRRFLSSLRYARARYPACPKLAHSKLVFTEPRQGSDVEKVIAKLGDLRAQGLQTDIERASSGPTNITAGTVSPMVTSGVAC